MEPQLDKEEQYVREQLRRHEFPFDERAWAAMEVLLAESQRPGGSAALWRRYGGWILLLATASALLLWQARPSQKKELDTPAPPAEAVAEAIQGASQGKRVAPAGDNRTLGQSASKDAEKTHGQRLASNPVTSVRATPVPNAVKGSKRLSHRYAHWSIISQPGAEELFRQSKRSEALLSSLAGDMEQTPEAAEIHLQALGAIVVLPVEAKLAPLSPSGSMPLLPRVVDITPQSPRIEHGLSIGLGASVLQWKSLTVTPALTLGYLFRCRFSPNTSWQAEAQMRSVSGYSLGGRIQENTPSGPLVVSHEVDGLIFFELPMGVHHRYRPDQAFFIGVRPSWNMPMRTQTTAFRSAPVPTNAYSVREGLRAFDMGVSVGWEWRLHPRWALDARLTQGTINLASEGFFDGVNRLYNTDLQVSLRYFTAPDKRALAVRL
ncbi:MAG: hypothetical protein RMJ33_08985 [Saprospiraceae bacterium]|nr:PorT family protein [Saprospiraceae bacterium]MDW8229958.1 hypothetical protein [Saprospiraceae bacterium]